MESKDEAGEERNVLRTLKCPKSGKLILHIKYSKTDGTFSRFLTEFEEQELIGSGGYGSVSLCKNKLDGREYAVKKIAKIPVVFQRGAIEGEAADIEAEVDDELYEFGQIIREVHILAQLDHPNVVRYYSAWPECHLEGYEEKDEDYGKSQEGAEEKCGESKEGPCLYIQMSYCPKALESELDRLRSNPVLAIQVITQIIEGVAYIHGKEIVHLDLARDNILLDKDDTVRIGDFGIAKYIGERSPKIGGGKVLYLAPEVIAEEDKEEKGEFIASTKADMFSLGIIFYEVLVEMKTDMERCETLKKLRGGNMETVVDRMETGDNMKQLLKRLLDKNPESRPEASYVKDAFVPPIITELIGGI
ncbi:Tyrosine-protein kinase [Trema orientale]|uniref:Tyrosine-protein kinase n=1 Tax=Trema orientale TaxID=63057 RepID=A0A2P5AT63_TREOI|nr:Tyrosine-protein kinase [Trema orientale]